MTIYIWITSEKRYIYSRCEQYQQMYMEGRALGATVSTRQTAAYPLDLTWLNSLTPSGEMGWKFVFAMPLGHVQALSLRSTTQNRRLSFLSLRLRTTSLSVCQDFSFLPEPSLIPSWGVGWHPF